MAERPPENWLHHIGHAQKPQVRRVGPVHSSLTILPQQWPTRQIEDLFESLRNQLLIGFLGAAFFEV